jgi:hypothetical protein
MMLTIVRRWLTTPIALAIVLSLANMASAQRSGSYSSGQGGYANSNGTGGRLPFSTSGASGGMMSGMGGMGGGYGAGGFGATGMGAGIGGANSGAFGQTGMGMGAGQTTGALGANGGQPFQAGGFVGRDAADVRGTFDNMSGRAGRGARFDMMVENMNEMRESRRRWREQNTAVPLVRVRLMPAFDLPPTAPAEAAAAVQARLIETVTMRGIGSTQVELNGRTAILRGSVSTARERELVERLAWMEPGVSEVQNLLTVSAPEPGAETAPEPAAP